MLSDWNETCARCMDGEIEPRHCEYYGEPNGCNSPTYGEHPPVGNAAAMRDIVTALANVILPPRGKADEDGWLAWVRAMQAKARAALSAPPRNCDRFQVAAEALREWQSLVKAKPNTWDFRYNYWLFAPAPERKGEGDGSK